VGKILEQASLFITVACSLLHEHKQMFLSCPHYPAGGITTALHCWQLSEPNYQWGVAQTSMYLCT